MAWDAEIRPESVGNRGSSQPLTNRSSTNLASFLFDMTVCATFKRENSICLGGFTGGSPSIGVGVAGSARYASPALHKHPRTQASSRTSGHLATTQSYNGLCGTDAVATLPLYIHKTRGLSCDHEDAIDATWHRDDAVDAT